MSWIPFANGFNGVVHEREGRAYILWKGDKDGRNKVKRLRVNEETKKKLVENLQNE